MDSNNIWFDIKKLCAQPGMPNTCRGVLWKARSEGWMSRPRKGRGGGREYPLSCLPPETQAAVLLKRNMGKVDPLCRVEDANPSKPSSQSLWVHYESRPNGPKEEAERRLRALLAVNDLVAAGTPKTTAVKAVAQQNGESYVTIYRWMDLVKGIHRSDWLAALVPRYSGGKTSCEITPEVWDSFKADYLRTDKPATAACYNRLKRIAAQNGWDLPSLRTLERRIEATIPRPVLILAREGEESLKAIYPAQERDHGFFSALEAVNADGHRLDVFVTWHDGTIIRPIMAAWQDIYSGKILSYRVAKTENTDSIRLAFGDMVQQYGIPRHAYLDNGRGFASKWLTGGVANRYRFKVKDEDPVGIMVSLGVEIHWCTPYHGQAKPIERAFRDFSEYIAKHPAFEGAYTGRSPSSKPENYGSRAVPYKEFMGVLHTEIAEHNARTGRRSAVCAKRSFDQVFAESYTKTAIRKATDEQMRLWLLAAEGVRASQQDGSITIMDNRYWNEKLSEVAGEKLVARLDPDQLYQPIHVYTLDGRYIGQAECVQRAGFGDTEAAREHARLRGHFVKNAKKNLELERKIGAMEVAKMLPEFDPAEVPEAKVISPIFQQFLRTGTDDQPVDIGPTESRFMEVMALVRAEREEQNKSRIF